MKAPAFAYHRPDTLEDAFALLGRYGDEAQILAGGQSLMPMLNMRVSNPAALIDMNRIAVLRGIEDRPDCVRVGAMTRYVELEESTKIRSFVPLIGLALPSYRPCCNPQSRYDRWKPRPVRPRGRDASLLCRCGRPALFWRARVELEP